MPGELWLRLAENYGASPDRLIRLLQAIEGLVALYLCVLSVVRASGQRSSESLTGYAPGQKLWGSLVLISQTPCAFRRFSDCRLGRTRALDQNLGQFPAQDSPPATASVDNCLAT